MANDSKHYRQKAAEMLGKAEATKDEPTKRGYLDLAETWTAMAERAERNQKKKKSESKQ